MRIDLSVGRNGATDQHCARSDRRGLEGAFNYLPAGPMLREIMRGFLAAEFGAAVPEPEIR